MIHYCTLFDKNYLYKGLALYESLRRHSPDSVLWILALDQETLTILGKLKLPQVKLISLATFEDPHLKKVKPTRTLVEYYWTMTPSLPLFILKKHPAIPMITYLDADLYFFANPAPLFEEMGSASVVLTPHRFPSFLQYKQKESGTYNVQFLIFRNDHRAKLALKWWRERCLEWCYFRYEDGKLGDQLYLNDWHSRFRGVHVIKHQGGGLAPWNVLRYRYSVSNNQRLYVDNKPLIFYHFHGFQLLTNGRYRYAPHYGLPKAVVNYIYVPYRQALQRSVKKVKKINNSFRAGYHSPPGLVETASSFLFAQKLKILGLSHGS